MWRLQPQTEAPRLLTQGIIEPGVFSQQPTQDAALGAFLGLSSCLVAEENQRGDRGAMFDGVEIERLQLASARDDPDVAIDFARDHNRRQDARHRHAIGVRALVGIDALWREGCPQPRQHTSAAQMFQQHRRAAPLAQGVATAVVDLSFGASGGQHAQTRGHRSPRAASATYITPGRHPAASRHPAPGV